VSLPSDESKADEAGGAHGFIVGGSRQLVKGIRAAIEKEVEAEFSERRAKANWYERLRLRWHMRTEIDRRTATDIAKQMPSKEALW
jgi:hypothetical protein